MVTFDDVLPTVLRVCETYPGFGAVTKATIVRDLKGCVHLALQLPDRSTFDVDALEHALAAELGPWFVGPVLGPQVSFELARLRGTVLRQNAPWRGSWIDPLAGTPHETLPGKWHRIERHLSKLAWTGTTPAKLPWGLVAHRPAIVTFFSFKGGVGRTTLLASTAMQLAADGKRVVAIDLDVEAPGLGSILGAATRRGVVDFLVDHYATDTIDLDDLFAPASAIERGALLIDVIPAGNMDATYFDKLARLDFVGSGLIEPSASSPVRDSLRQLITAIARRDPPPDYILVDSRAGLHDVAGLSLHDLAHVDVLVGRDSDQSYQGLELTVAALGQRRAFNDIRCVVVQSMAPDDPGTNEYERITTEYRRRSYGAFAAHVYERDESGDDIPELDDDSAAHYPRVIRFDQRLLHFSSIEARRVELTGADFALVKERIVEQCLPEPEAGALS
jgi:MinD-like ATPase involved in chromosome partitioning or flagellar assembly